MRGERRTGSSVPTRPIRRNDAITASSGKATPSPAERIRGLPHPHGEAPLHDGRKDGIANRI